jgi:hypothetical protein
MDALHNAENLIELDRVLRRTFHDFWAEESPLPAALLSDSMVVAAPTGPEVDDASALNEILVQSAILQLQLVGSGFFARGAMTIGALHIHDGIVFGPALVAAYQLEREQATNPRVVLNEEAREILRNDLGAYSGAAPSIQSRLLLVDQDGVAFIDYLDFVLDEVDPDAGLRIHRKAIEDKLAEHIGDRRKWEKYRWVADYHNQFCRRGKALSSHEIPQAAITPQFGTFD